MESPIPLQLLAILKAILSSNPSTRQLLKFYELLPLPRIRNPFTKENKSFTRHSLPLCMLAVVHALQVWVTISPGALAFNRDMFLDIPLYADILAICNNRQLLVDKRLVRENAKRIQHDYAVGDMVWKKNY
jgi:hypothetical protein